MVLLKLGPSLDPDNIAEGNDVYFECSVSARPEPYKVVWLHDVSTKLRTNIFAKFRESRSK